MTKQTKSIAKSVILMILGSALTALTFVALEKIGHAQASAPSNSGSAIAMMADAGAMDAAGSGSAAQVVVAHVSIDSTPVVIDPASTIDQIYTFMRTGKGTAAVGLIMILIVWGFRSGLGSKWAWWKTPIGGYVIGFSLPAVTYFGTAISSDNPITASLIINALGAGWVAAGGWQHLQDLIAKVKAGGNVAGKKAAGTALVLGLVIGLVSCAHFKGMSGKFKTCAQADLGQIIQGKGPLLDYISKLISSNASELEAELTATAIQAGTDAVICAIAAYDSVKNPAIPAGSDSLVTAKAPEVGLARANDWATSHGGAQ